jgi:hypothetical protein
MQEAAAKYRRQWEEEHRQRQELEMANIRMAREGLTLQEKQRGLERECASLKQTVAILEERCKLKETTFVDVRKHFWGRFSVLSVCFCFQSFGRVKHGNQAGAKR